jgi:Asp-tRNA(Asn)/Glu-tRNA(Gln) amidotransferase A subunit family amidase
MTEEDLCYLSAGGALDMFGSGKLSPVELLRALLARTAGVNAAVNALADLYFDEALQAARQSETRWRQGRPRPLEGIPVVVKDAQRIAGRRTTFGSLVHKNNVEPNSDPMIERLLDAGAIIHARTTTSEFCISGICRSPVWGNTRNPWNLHYGPGGSSGGSGAALAAGMTILATGTDMGGSIRIPASACGVVGYKPPHGRNPDGPPWNLEWLNHCGPLARSVEDVALVQNVVSGPHPLDHDSLRESPRLPRDSGDIRGFRVAYSLDLGYRRVDPEVRRNTLEAVETFRTLGCEIEEIELGWTEDIDRLCVDWFSHTHLGRSIARHARTCPELLSADMLRLADGMAGQSSLDGVVSMIDLANRMYRTFGPIMASHDILVCPTMTIPAVPADHQMFDPDFRIDGQQVDPEFGYSTTHQFNVLRNCPVMSVPSGFAGNGVPTGIQIVGRTFDDASVYRAARAYELARGRWYGSAASRPAIAAIPPGMRQTSGGIPPTAR